MAKKKNKKRKKNKRKLKKVKKKIKKLKRRKKKLKKRRRKSKKKLKKTIKIKSSESKELIFKVPKKWSKRAYVDKKQYEKKYKLSIKDNDGFWRKEGKRTKENQKKLKK